MLEFEQAFLLAPLRIGRLRNVLVNVEERRFRMDGGVVTGHVAEARVGYTGSPLLWYLKPAEGFRFPYRGRVAEASVGMRAYWEGMDLTSFAKQVEDDLTRAREAVAAYRSEIEKWNEAIRQKISDTVRFF